MTCLLQIFIRKDGYVEDADEESEQLLAPLDSPVHSYTIPELASVAQVLAPNAVAAEMQSASLHAVQDADALSKLQQHDTAHALQDADTRSTLQQHEAEQSSEDDENSDPNQRHAEHSLKQQDLELQPLAKRGLKSDQHKVCLFC